MFVITLMFYVLHTEIHLSIISDLETDIYLQKYGKIKSLPL